MGNYYKMVGSQDPGARIDRVLVEESPEKVLELNGDPVELDDLQVERVGRYVKLAIVLPEDEEPESSTKSASKPAASSEKKGE